MVKALLADADGTLVDTVYLVRQGLYDTIRQALIGHGVEPAEIPTYGVYLSHVNWSVGGTARATIEQVMRSMFEASPQRLVGLDFDAVYAALDPIQDELAPQHVRAYSMLLPALRKIGGAGVKMAIVTSGTPRHVMRNFGVALPELGCTELYLEPGLDFDVRLRKLERAMEQVFEISQVAIVTGTDVAHAKPNPEMMHVAMDRLDVTAGRCAVLGDHSVDMIAGKRSGVLLRIGVTHGFDDEATLRGSGATNIIHSLEELPGVVLMH